MWGKACIVETVGFHAPRITTRSKISACMRASHTTILGRSSERHTPTERASGIAGSPEDVIASRAGRIAEEEGKIILRRRLRVPTPDSSS